MNANEVKYSASAEFVSAFDINETRALINTSVKIEFITPTSLENFSIVEPPINIIILYPLTTYT